MSSMIFYFYFYWKCSEFICLFWQILVSETDGEHDEGSANCGDSKLGGAGGWGGAGLFRRGAVSQSQELRTLTRLCSVCAGLWSPRAPFELQQDGAAIGHTG